MQENTSSQDQRQIQYNWGKQYKNDQNGIRLVMAIIILLSLFVCFLAFFSMISANQQASLNVPQTPLPTNVAKPTKENKTNLPDAPTKKNPSQQPLVIKKQQPTPTPLPTNTSAKVYRDVNNILSFAPLYSGEIHYARIPYQYWQHRLLMIKALGFNSIGVYIFWNHHQLQRGVFDFANGDRNLVDFLKLAQKHNLKVLLRPGPYVCAQWDFGGIPARLLGIQGLTVRTSNDLYEEQLFLYFTALAEIIKPFLEINKGNIILLQIENQLGSYGDDRKHTLNLLQMWKILGVQCNFYYQDGFTNWRKHYWEGSSFGISQGQHLEQYTQLQQSNSFKDKLIFGGEVYTGWLTHWGQKWNGLDTNAFKGNLNGLLSNNRSFNLYLIHGGSNFGLSAGANDFHNIKYMPHVTSYDYDCPINEQGRSTPKYEVIKQLMAKYGKVQATPQPIKSISVPPITLILQANLFLNLPQPNPISKLTFFENDQIRMYHQGLVIYETILPTPKQYHLNLIVHDFALIYVDGKLQGSILRDKFKQVKKITVKCQKGNCTLKIIIEAMGHVNYGAIQAEDRKGLLHFQVEGESNPFNWEVYRISLNDTTVLQWKNKDKQMKGVTLLKGTFDLKQTGDTFLDFQPFVKGYVWVNNHLLGRYWNIGPQHRIFCPGVWLKETQNEIFALQLIEVKSFEVKGVETLR